MIVFIGTPAKGNLVYINGVLKKRGVKSQSATETAVKHLSGWVYRDGLGEIFASVEKSYDYVSHMCIESAAGSDKYILICLCSVSGYIPILRLRVSAL